MKITLRTLEPGEKHFCHPVATCGDWQAWSNGAINCTVDNLNDPDSEFAVLVHELIEAWLCRKRGITHERVTLFDGEFESEREAGRHSQEAEPGDDPRAPYRREHQFATAIEMLLLHEIGKFWSSHCRTVVNNGH